MAMPAALTKKVAGLPVGAWLLIVAAGIGIGLYLRKRNAGNIEEAPLEEGGEVVPFEELPMENTYGDYMTGGGPPVVGGSAIRLEGPSEPIRIIIRNQGGGRQPCRRGFRRNKQGRCVRIRSTSGTHNCRQGMRWSTRKKRCVKA
jgi:hypothetical protein